MYVRTPRMRVPAVSVTSQHAAALPPLRGEQARQYLEAHHPYDWQEMLAFPKHVDIDTINTCNARCRMCGIDFDRRKVTRMTDQLFDKIVAELAEHRTQVDRVGLAVNSEPLMDRGLAGKIAKLKQAGIRCASIITNASLLTPQRSEELLGAGLDQTYISIDSLDPSTYEEIRRGLVFEEAYRNACQFVGLKQRLRPAGTVRIAMVQLKENHDEAEAFVRHWMPLLGPRDEVVVTRGFNWGVARNVVARSPSDDEEHNRVPCISLWTSFVVDVDGQVRMCCADPEGKTLLGDLRQDSITDIWRGQKLARARQLHFDGRRREIAMCDGCPVWSTTKHALKHRGVDQT